MPSKLIALIAAPLMQVVGLALAHRHSLLNNCEHVFFKIAVLVVELLAVAPMLVVLATSRLARRLSHERRYRLVG